ncbi:MAG: ferrous iron transporter B [Solobacterium sp.]|nr:ferrous iron transporter B [Solobacterium sp.]
MSEKKYVIALAGNPNSGKTTLFNALTGSNQYVGNWPGVTVEKKEGKLKGHPDVMIEDLPGIYSLSPYTMEEVVSRNYLVEEKPDAILNIVDGTNLERNLYLTTQLSELGIPMVVAVNMTDLLEKENNKIDLKLLSQKLGCEVISISALKGMNVDLIAEAAVKSAKEGKAPTAPRYNAEVEEALSKIKDLLPNVSETLKRWYSIKLFERDDKALNKLSLDSSKFEKIIKTVEENFDDDAEAIITNERYEYIANELRGDSTVSTKGSEKLTISDRIDRIVTNRWLALPIFGLIMFLVYYLTVSTVGSVATDWTNDGLFGDGFFLFGNGREQYTEAMNSYYEQNIFTNEVKEKVAGAVEAGVPGAEDIQGAIDDVDYEAFDESFGFYGSELEEKEGGKYAISDVVEKATGEEAEMPSPEQFGTWIPGIPVLVENVLDSIGTNDFLKGLILDGIIGGVGAVLGFVPQMLVLFFLLAILEYCGYMARIAFVMDRLFRKFGLSGKSFIPVMIGTGCGVPGVMASRTIENERDRRMTIMTTTFIPCGAKLPIIMMIATALFGGSSLIAVSAYFIGLAAIVISGIILKKTKMFAGDPAPFVMELPAYHIPTLGAILRSTWERGWSFIKKAGTIILISSIIIWLGSTFGWTDGNFGWNPDLELESSVLGAIGNSIKWIFAPLGFDSIKATIATVMGLVAKEEVVGVFGVLDFEGLTKLAGYSFLVFNLLCAPCFAAIGAIKREMNNAKWTWFAIGYQCLFAYVISLIIYQLGILFTGGGFGIWTIVAIAALICLVWLLFRPYKEATRLETKLANN